LNSCQTLQTRANKTQNPSKTLQNKVTPLQPTANKHAQKNSQLQNQAQKSHFKPHLPPKIATKLQNQKTKPKNQRFQFRVSS